MFLQSDIEKVKDANPIEQVVQEVWQVKKGGINYIGLCPFHQEKTPSFSVSPSKQIFKCFGCGAAGDVVHFIERFKSLDFTEAIKWLADRGRVEITPQEKQKDVSALVRTNNKYADLWRKALTGEPLDYMRERGFTVKQLKEWQVGYCANTTLSPEKGLELVGLMSPSGQCLMSGRIIFPIQSMLAEHIVGFAGRVLDNSKPKYLNTPSTDLYNKSEILYGWLRAKAWVRENNATKVILVEGYTDVIMMHQHGVGNVVATCGTALTPAMARLLGTITQNVVIMRDGDEAGKNATKRDIEVLLSSNVRPLVATLSPGEDPCSYWIKGNLSEMRSMVMTASDFLSYLFSQKDSIDAELVKNCINVVSKIVSPIEKELQLKNLSSLSGIQQKTLLKELQAVIKSNILKSNPYGHVYQ